LEGLLDRTFHYCAADHDSIEVTASGNPASMVGKSRVLAAVYGGGKHCWRLRGDFTMRKETDAQNFPCATAIHLSWRGYSAWGFL